MKKQYDFWILIISSMLVALGSIMVFSASPPSAYTYNGDAFYFIQKQIIMVGIGVVVMIAAMNFDYKRLGQISPILFFASIGLLVLVLVPGLGTASKGATRWLFNFQPSEVVKITLILFFSHFIAVKGEKVREFKAVLLPCIVYLGGIFFLLKMQPHMSAIGIIGIIAVILLFCGGVRLDYLGVLGALGGATVGVSMFSAEHSRIRITSFISSIFNESEMGWQATNSLIAIGSGGLFGKGLTKSTEKFLYIPEPHNDFILSILAEELGYIAVVFVIILFALLIFRGYRVAINVKDKQGSLMAIGITSMIAIQFILNVAVVSGIFPATGIPLPFFSYGGTSLILLMGAVGILLNISKSVNLERIEQ